MGSCITLEVHRVHGPSLQLPADGRGPLRRGTSALRAMSGDLGASPGSDWSFGSLHFPFRLHSMKTSYKFFRYFFERNFYNFFYRFLIFSKIFQIAVALLFVVWH